MGPLQKRILTALVLIPLVAAAVLLLPGLGFAVAMGVFAVLAALEWRQVGALPSALRIPFLVLVAVSLPGVVLLVGEWTAFWGVLGCALSFWVLALAWVVSYQRATALPGIGSAAVRVLTGWLLIVPCYMSLLWLHRERPSLVMYLLVLIWVADSGAYFAGRHFGHRKLASRVSPGKSWEGVAGGLAGVVVLSLGLAYADPGAWPAAGVFLALSLAVALASVLGDLVESLFKRHAGVKDSGTLIPGHGGVLDRIDSITAAGPVFAAGWAILGGSP